MTPKGYRYSTVEAAIKKPGRRDMALIVSDLPAVAAAVFTTNRVVAAPVILSRRRIEKGKCRAILVNSGNANACTGDQGLADASRTSRMVADALGIDPDSIQVASTGVIGVPFPMDRISRSIPPLVDGVGRSSLDEVARAIMTTDTFPKVAHRTISLDGIPCTISGIAKGAGMIQPNMATMLSFILTDAAVDRGWLDQLFREGVDRSFNAITVDGDTSTNDTALILANGAAGNPPLAAGSPGADLFAAALHDLLLELAMMIVKDGEGATKVVTVRVRGALTVDDARRAARAIANSSLVKTAFFGEDANWGRIFAAAGYSGAEFDQSRTDLWFDDVQMVSGGLFAGGDAEARGTEVMKRPQFTVTVDFRMGDAEAVIYTCDLTHEYVSINADYRT
ncbi:MAG: bifunctional glutamate N-acetyltransferase/amino-acid acetyltransferase ArgJ [Desulfuromonadia bacterium]